MEKQKKDEVRVEAILVGVKVGDAKKAFSGDVSGKGGKVHIHTEAMGIAAIEKGFKGVEVESATVWVMDTPNIELLGHKSQTQLDILGIEITDEVEAGLRAFNLNTFDNETAAQIHICTRISQRANRKVKESDHQLTWFDVAQACGLVHESKQGDARATRVKAYGDRVVSAIKMAEAEKLKDERAAKAKAKKEAAAKEEKPKAKAKAKTKAALSPKAAKDE